MSLQRRAEKVKKIKRWRKSSKQSGAAVRIRAAQAELWPEASVPGLHRAGHRMGEAGQRLCATYVSLCLACSCEIFGRRDVAASDDV